MYKCFLLIIKYNHIHHINIRTNQKKFKFKYEGANDASDSSRKSTKDPSSRARQAP